MTTFTNAYRHNCKLRLCASKHTHAAETSKFWRTNLNCAYKHVNLLYFNVMEGAVGNRKSNNRHKIWRNGFKDMAMVVGVNSMSSNSSENFAHSNRLCTHGARASYHPQFYLLQNEFLFTTLIPSHCMPSHSHSLMTCSLMPSQHNFCSAKTTSSPLWNAFWHLARPNV